MRQAGKLDDVLADRGISARLGEPVSRFELFILGQKQLRRDRCYSEHRKLHEIGLGINDNRVAPVRHRFPSPGAVLVCGDEYHAASDEPPVCGQSGPDDGAHPVGTEVHR